MPHSKSQNFRYTTFYSTPDYKKLKFSTILIYVQLAVLSLNSYLFQTIRDNEFSKLFVYFLEVVSGSGWWGRACCAFGRATSCRRACATASDAEALSASCRRSDEIAFFDCVQRQQEAQWCCCK